MRIKKTYLIYLAMGITVGLMAFSSLNQAQATTFGTKGTIYKDEIMVASGFWQGGNVYNPFRGDMSFPAWSMWDTLFCHNNSDPAKADYVGILGESFGWNDSTGQHLEVVMKSTPKWSDGEAITTEDFNFTYSLLGGAWDAKVEEIEIVNDTYAVCNLYSTATFSQEIWDFVSRARPLVPAHIWDEVVEDGLEGDDHNWGNTSYPAEWKVFSGPYQPYYAEPWVEDIFIRFDDYWGFADLTAEEIAKKPKYISHVKYPNNAGAAQAMAVDKLDYSGQYMSQVWEIIEGNANVSTWYKNNNSANADSIAPYYVAESSVMELLFNPRKFPYTEIPVREAIGQSINYDSILTVAGLGYFRRARVGRIDNETAPHIPAYDATVEATYALDYNTSQLVDKLNDIYTGSPASYNASIAGPCKIQLDLAVIDGNGELDPRTAWAAANDTNFPADVSGATPGLQVPLVETTQKIDVVAAWSDFNVIADQVALDLDKGFGFPAIANKIAESAWVGTFGSGNDGTIANWDMSLHTGSPKTQEPAYRAFAWMIGNPTCWGQNPHNWVGGCDNLTINPFYNDSFKTAFDTFDISAVGSAAYNTSASTMQTILAEERASIPLGYNCLWYTVNNKWFTGWATGGNPWLHTVPSSASYDPGSVRTLLLGLEATGTLDPNRAPVPLPFVPALMGLVGLALVAALIKRRKK